MPIVEARFTVTLHEEPPSPQTMPAACTVPPAGLGEIVSV